MSGAIHLPENYEAPPRSGVVIAVAEDVDPKLLGSKVIFPEWAGLEFTVDAERLLILVPSELYATIGEDPGDEA